MENKIRTILSNLTEAEITKVTELFDKMGVLLWEDLNHLQPPHFQGTLKLVQAKKSINSWSMNSANVSVSADSSSSTVLASSSSSSLDSADEWDFSFQIPWLAFPQGLTKACESNSRPLHRDCLEMIRIIVDKVLERKESCGLLIKIKQ